MNDMEPRSPIRLARRTFPLFLLASGLLAVFAAGCNSTGSVIEERIDVDATLEAGGPPPTPYAKGFHMAIGRANPTYGGHYRAPDDRSVVTVLMTDTSDVEGARSALSGIFGPQEMFSEVRIEQADYSYFELATWYGLFGQRISRHIDGISTTGIAGHRNRIEISLLDLAESEKLTALLREHRIPA